MVWLIVVSAVVGSIVFGAVGLAVGYILKARLLAASVVASQRASEEHIGAAEQRSRDILNKARSNADRRARDMVNKARSNADRKGREIVNRAKAEARREQENIQNAHRKLDKRERLLTEREKQTEYEALAVKEQAEEAEKMRAEYLGAVEKVATLTANEARDQIIKKVEEELESEINRRYTVEEKKALEIADEKARYLLAGSIQRIAADVTSEVSTTTIKLSNADETKGRLIGKEGRNIRAIEKATEVDILMDENPDSITLSSFDPKRREIARLSLESLIRDGRIQPVRIEKTVATVTKEFENKLQKIGTDAAQEVGVKQSLEPEILRLLGQLKYRTSYGSNVLQHSIEVGLIAGVIAAEIGADVADCRTAGLLHDIGKALSHEVKGPHAEIGADLVAKYRMPEVIIKAIREHHDRDMTTTTSYIVAAADAISASRPGARKDTAQQFIQRMTDLENIARSFNGVSQVYAVQSGHELRVLVNPKSVNDSKMKSLARGISNKISEQLAFPGEINITVIRESRVSEVSTTKQ